MKRVRPRSHASFLARVVGTLGLAVATCGCGYRPIHGGEGGERFVVVLARSMVPDAVAADEVLAGAREELARLGALAPSARTAGGDDVPRCEIEVLRADEVSEGIAASPNLDGRLLPSSRATRVGITARAWVSRGARAANDPTDPSARERDTGDLRAFETVAVAGDARASMFRHSDALRVAGRRAGRRLAARIMGLPAPNED